MRVQTREDVEDLLRVYPNLTPALESLQEDIERAYSIGARSPIQIRGDRHNYADPTYRKAVILLDRKQARDRRLQEKRLVEEWLDLLSPDQRRVVELRLLRGLTVTGAAVAMGRPPAYVVRQIRSALDVICDHMQIQEEEPEPEPEPEPVKRGRFPKTDWEDIRRRYRYVLDEEPAVAAADPGGPRGVSEGAP